MQNREKERKMNGNAMDQDSVGSRGREELEQRSKSISFSDVHNPLLT